MIKTLQAPFLLTRVAWGYFEVRFEIEFKPATGLGKKNLHHMLSFEGSGITRGILLQVNDTGTNTGNIRAVSAALAEQIDRVEQARAEAAEFSGDSDGE